MHASRREYYMSLVNDIWSILGPAQKRQVVAAQGISLLMALSTVTGIAAIAPFLPCSAIRN